MMEYQDSGEIQYNDFSGYFENLESDIPLRIPKNVKLLKAVQQMVEEYFSLTAQQDIEQIKKDELILEMASTLEQIYINAAQPHLVETIASSLCLILNKKDKITSPSHIYSVLEKKYKNRYSTEVGRSKRGDIFAKRNVMFNDFREDIAGVINFFQNMPFIDSSKQQELIMLLNRFEEVKRICNIQYVISQDNSNPNNNINGETTGLPQEAHDSNNNNSNTSSSSSETEGEGRREDNNNNNNNQNSPTQFKSKYYLRLEQYIMVLEKLKENVLQYPPSKELDEKLDNSLAIEIELLMPSIDMKYKRSIPQLDETIQYADRQSLNGASSVMHEDALIHDNEKGNLEDPNNRYNKFLEITHKLTPEQIDTRRPYISIIRKRMQKYQPHLFYHLQWYEGTKDHKLSMGKFARSNLLRKKMVMN